MVNPDVDGDSETINQRKILRKTQKSFWKTTERWNRVS